MATHRNSNRNYKQKMLWINTVCLVYVATISIVFQNCINHRLTILYTISGFYLGFEIWGGGGGGEAIVDNVAVGGGCRRGMCSLPHPPKTEALYDLTKLKKQLLCDKRRHY